MPYTLSGTEVAKVFQNENKLFELNRSKPVGLMLYNATNFFDIPLEVIIKDFRSKKSQTPCSHLFNWSECFRDFLVSQPQIKPTEASQQVFVERLLFGEMDRIVATWGMKTERLLFERQTPRVRNQYAVVLQQCIKERLDFYEAADFYKGFDDTSAVHLLSNYQVQYENSWKLTFGHFPNNDAHNDMLRKLGGLVLTKVAPGPLTTGLVFAGFGDDEIFPSLICLEISGVVGDVLRWQEVTKVDIDRSGSTAEIIPFAQRDTVDSLLFGRSANYEKQVVKHFEEALYQISHKLIDRHVRRSALRKKDAKAKLDATIKAVVSRFHNERSGELQKEFAKDTLDIVRHMPKQDLAAFAESLVTVSAMKRKTTVGPETVGGPIDVAIISRHEGFIWVKRKHYFESGLNQRYMARAFGAQREGLNDGRDHNAAPDARIGAAPSDGDD